MRLGQLKEVDIRKVWPHEQYDFSSWLSREENITELSKVLNLSLTNIETEKFVGNYRCDILCKDELTGKNVLIENQLEPTNHDHLGKIITYASGLGASVVVWVVGSARVEHATAIEWLNNNTTEELAFFLIEIHAYKIGDSDTAPYFKIIEQPNEFVRSTKLISNSGNLSTTEEKRIEFWTKFNEIVVDRGKPFNTTKVSKDHWYTVAIGSSQCYVKIDLINKDHSIRVSLWIPDNKEVFDNFAENIVDIEKAIGRELVWDRLEGKKASYVCTYIKGLDFNKQENYPELMNELIDLAVLFRDVFKKYI